MKQLLIMALCLLLVISVSGQSKGERKKNKIKSITEWATDYDDPKPESYKSVYEEFDKEGHSVLRTEYGSDGAILSRVTSKYDSYGNKTEETEYDASKKKNVKKAYKYNAFKDKTEELEFNSAGTLLMKTLFEYDGDGNKIAETTYDGAGTVLEKTTYTYNSKNLKTGKQTLKNGSIPDSGKKWDYVYY
jgi:hypothetical protein